MASNEHWILWWNVRSHPHSLPWFAQFSTLVRHVARTGDIKDIVVVEESGIAKGIRRIVAVTGQEAHDVTQLADTFRDRLNNLERLSGKEKDANLKAFAVVRNFPTQIVHCITHQILQELGQAEISVTRKADLKERLAAIRKAFDKQVKEKEAAANKEVAMLPRLVLIQLTNVFRLSTTS